jgi:hypothetical protein
MPKIKCDYCGKSIERAYWELKRLKHFFCDSSCYKKWLSLRMKESGNPNWKGSTLDVKCSYCGKKLRRSLYYSRDGNFFCNFRCLSNFRKGRMKGRKSPRWKPRVKVSCSFCGKILMKRQWYVNKYKHIFCSKECRRKWLSSYIKENRPRTKITERTCKVCGKKFIIPIAWVRRKGRNGGSFCSRKCQNVWLLQHIRRPNKSEKLLDEIIQQHIPGEWSYNGDYRKKVSIGGRIPDWVNINGQRKIIELFGVFFHDPKISSFKIKPRKTVRVTVQHYRKYGYQCLIIWDYELKSPEKVIEKIRSFTF